MAKSRIWTVPEDGKDWITDDVLSLLKDIRGKHAAKQRSTVIAIAFARANQIPIEEVFKRRDTCNQRIWYQKWQYDPKLVTALEACYEAAQGYKDSETIAHELYYTHKRRRAIAKYASDAPAALAAVMDDHEQRGADRINAADTLMRWAEPDTAGKVHPGTSIDASVNFDIDTAIERELADLASGAQDADASEVEEEE